MDEKETSTLTEMEKQEAETLMSLYLDDNVSHRETIERYSQTSDKYEMCMKAFGFTSHIETAATMAELFPCNRDEVYILDIAAGTGWCGIEMQKFGFRKMDGLDASLEMMEKAKMRNLYFRYIHQMLGEDNLDIADDTYDAITISSMSTPVVKDLPLNALTEMIRVVKPGGFIINTHSDAVITGDNALRRNTEILEDQGKWKRIKYRRFCNFSRGKDGISSVHQVY